MVRRTRVEEEGRRRRELFSGLFCLSVFGDVAGKCVDLAKTCSYFDYSRLAQREWCDDVWNIHIDDFKCRARMSPDGALVPNGAAIKDEADGSIV